ncbi:MAG: hypothetical protein OXP73_12495 [Chloroflexota bacterium]|nr:hypothetical protein [Chloroflexota bacterium]
MADSSGLPCLLVLQALNRPLYGSIGAWVRFWTLLMIGGAFFACGFYLTEPESDAPLYFYGVGAVFLVLAWSAWNMTRRRETRWGGDRKPITSHRPAPAAFLPFG